ncbi:MAG TPA: phage baseplate assembly protein V [Rhodocyclaceae bacterium]|nr:phage baseplate assembly protein V [Rhodocyclaceae bacterium]
MSDLIEILRAVIRDEMERRRAPELGIVTEVLARESESSDNNHQVKVRLRDSGVELQWVPVAVGRLGLSLLPQVGDLVLVVFVGGDLNSPVVVGSLYDAQVQPPVAKPAEVVYQPTDAQDASLRRFHLELANGSTLTIDEDKLTVALGGTEVVINRDGDVAIKSAAKLSIQTQGDMSLEASGNLDLKAQGNVTVSGVSATVEGQGSAKLKAPAVSLAGNTQFSPS